MLLLLCACRGDGPVMHGGELQRAGRNGLELADADCRVVSHVVLFGDTVFVFIVGVVYDALRVW